MMTAYVMTRDDSVGLTPSSRIRDRHRTLAEGSTIDQIKFQTRVQIKWWLKWDSEVANRRLLQTVMST
jgi:hypothetical protein